MFRVVLRCIAITIALAAMLAGGRSEAAQPVSLETMRAALAQLSLTDKTQFMYLGRPYCWYPYGWAGPGWYWCGYGTRNGLGWGGSRGWNNWVVPRSYRAYRVAPAYRFRHYR